MEGSRSRVARRSRRKKGLRKRLRGDAERPRLTVFRSSKHIYAQIIDDFAGVTICSASTRAKTIREQIGNGGNCAAAKIVGGILAKSAQEKSVKAVCFDRNGFRYHGRVKALADAAREAGLTF